MYLQLFYLSNIFSFSRLLTFCFHGAKIRIFSDMAEKFAIIKCLTAQFHYLYGAVASELELAAVVYFAGVAKAAFLHHTTRGGVVGEVVAPECLEALFAEAVVNQPPQRLAADALVPIGSRHPIADLGIVLTYIDIALPVDKIAHAADGFACLFEFDGPHVVAAEEGTNNLQAFLDAFVGRPAGARPHLGVGGVFEERFGVAFAPRTQ